MSKISLSNLIYCHCIQNLSSKQLVACTKCWEHVQPAFWNEAVKWPGCLPSQNQGPLSFFLLSWSFAGLFFSHFSKKKGNMMLSTDSDYTVDLAASAKSYKSCLQRLQKQNKSDTKPTPIQRIKLFSICKDFPSWLNIRLSAASINRPLPDPLS